MGVLTDFVKCTREMVLNGNTVKVGNLAIFKATVESNGLEVLYDAQSDKVASATMGTLKVDWRLHPRRAEEGRQAELDGQDQGGDSSRQGRDRCQHRQRRRHRQHGL